MSHLNDLPEYQQNTVRNLLRSSGIDADEESLLQQQLVDTPVATTPDREKTLRVSSPAKQATVRIEIISLGAQKGVLPIMDEQDMNKLVR